MGLSTANKLKIREGNKLLTINAPEDFKKNLDGIPLKVSMSNTIKDPDQIHWFAKNKKILEDGFPGILPLIKENIICWIYFPKGASGIQTDLTRDKGWEKIREHELLQWITPISFDDVWSAFGVRMKPAKK